MQAPLVACREPVGSYNRLSYVLYVFEHERQYLLIHAPYTRIVLFWQIIGIYSKIFSPAYLLHRYEIDSYIAFQLGSNKLNQNPIKYTTKYIFHFITSDLIFPSYIKTTKHIILTNHAIGASVYRKIS